MERVKNMRAIPTHLSEVESYMKERIGLGVSFDLGVRKIKVRNKQVHLYYINGLTDNELVTELLKEIVQMNDGERMLPKVEKVIENRIVNQSVEKVSTMDEVVDQLLSGLIVLLVDGEKEAFVVDVRNYPGRQPEEPDTEKGRPRFSRWIC